MSASIIELVVTLELILVQLVSPVLKLVVSSSVHLISENVPFFSLRVDVYFCSIQEMMIHYAMFAFYLGSSSYYLAVFSHDDYPKSGLS